MDFFLSSQYGYKMSNEIKNKTEFDTKKKSWLCELKNCILITIIIFDKKNESESKKKCEIDLLKTKKKIMIIIINNANRTEHQTKPNTKHQTHTQTDR